MNIVIVLVFIIILLFTFAFMYQNFREMEQKHKTMINEQQEVIKCHEENMALIGQLEEALRPLQDDSDRYHLLCYYFEHDHGDLAIEAFNGVHPITQLSELIRIIDEKLDIMYQPNVSIDQQIKNSKLDD
jgi:cytochrome c-type biogenesis protein CcmH/NrfG